VALSGVALAQRLTTGKTLDVVYEFCNDLSLCPRGHVFVRDGKHIKCWCFAEEAAAQKFIERFRGEMIAAEDRPRWPGKVRKNR
jgi:uncharacterized protein CbrC (UPF0167 family)